MYIVQFPNVIETFQRALNEVLSPFLSTGNSAILMGDMPVIFYKCDILYSNDFLRDEKPRQNPFIALVGERAGARKTQKCTDSKGRRPYGYEVRQQVFRTIFVGIGRSLEFDPPPFEGNLRQATRKDADNIWSQLLLVMEHQWENFHKRGIYYPTLSSVPVQLQHKDYFLLTGQASMEIRFTFTRGN